MPQTSDRPLTAGQVAAAFNVTIETVRNWTESGHLACFRTPTGHRRFRREDVEKLLGHPIDGEAASA